MCQALGQGIEIDDVTVSGPLNLDSRRQRTRLRNKETGALLGADPREVQRREAGGPAWGGGWQRGCLVVWGLEEWGAGERGLLGGEAVSTEPERLTF